MIEVTYLVKI